MLNTSIRSRRDIAVVDVHDEKPSFWNLLPRNSPSDVFQGCDKKSCTSCVKDISADVLKNDIEHVGESS